MRAIGHQLISFIRNRMTNKKLQHLLDTDELDWDDPRHREIYLREWVNKDGKAFRDDEDDDPADDS